MDYVFKTIFLSMATKVKSHALPGKNSKYVAHSVLAYSVVRMLRSRRNGGGACFVDDIRRIVASKQYYIIAFTMAIKVPGPVNTV